MQDSAPLRAAEAEEEEVAVVPAGWAKAIAIKPSAAVQHAEACPGHIVLPRTDGIKTVKMILDLPLPRLVDARSWRCRTCKHQANHQQFPVTYADINAALKEQAQESLLVHAAAKRHAPVLMTKKFLLYALHKFYTQWNGRELRRDIANLYGHNSVALIGNPRADWRLQALPFAAALRSMAITAMHTLLPKEVAAMKFELLPYSASIVRGDGNYKIAKKLRKGLAEKEDRRPWSCILAWCGLDGSVLTPPTRSPTEDISDLKQDLRPLLQEIRDARLCAGMDVVQSAPVAHCTDRYAGHRLQLAALYGQAERVTNILQHLQPVYSPIQEHAHEF